MTGYDERRFRRATLVLLGLLAAIALFFLFRELNRAVGEQRVFAADLFQAEEASYCPGEVLRVAIEIAHMPAGPYTTNTLWVQEGGAGSEAVISRFWTERPNFNEGAYEGARLIMEREVPLDPLMQPGTAWEMRVVFRFHNDGWAVYQVPFLIGEDCDER